MSTNPASISARCESRRESDRSESRNLAVLGAASADSASVAPDPRDTVIGDDLDFAMSEWEAGR